MTSKKNEPKTQGLSHQEKSAPKMFEGLPGIFYIAVAWAGNIYTIYMGACSFTYYLWHLHQTPDACWIFQPICDLGLIFTPVAKEYMDRTEPWGVFKNLDKPYIYAWNMFWYGLFMLQHTGMKKPAFKKEIFPVSERLERGLYVFCAAFTWHMCFYMVCPLPTVIYEVKDLNLMLALSAFNFFGALFTWSTFFKLDFGSFMGLTQAYNEKPKNLPFCKDGLYGLMRHPQYFG